MTQTLAKALLNPVNSLCADMNIREVKPTKHRNLEQRGMEI